MSLRNSFSGLKKKLKRQVGGDRREPERRGAGTDGERVDGVVSLAQPEPDIKARGMHDRLRPGSEVGVYRGRVDSADPPPSRHSDVPASASAIVGVRGRGKWETVIMPADLEDVVEIEPSQWGNGADGERVSQADPSPFSLSISHNGGSGGMQTTRIFSRFP